MTRIFLHFAELHIGSSTRYENTLFGNYFLKCYLVKRILIPFNWLSEYSYPLRRAISVMCIFHMRGFVLEQKT